MRLSIFKVSCSLILVVLVVINAKPQKFEESKSISVNESENEIGLLETLKRLIEMEDLKGLLACLFYLC